MKLSVLTVPLYDRSFEDALTWLADHGVHTLEVGNGGFPGNTHINPDDYLGFPENIMMLNGLLKKYDMTIAALSCHGNCVHPDKAVAKKFQDDFEKTVLMAEQLGVDTIVTFSGCPGGSPEDKTPNWVTCSWPDDFAKILDYQWNEVLIPYWKEAVKFANAHGVKKIALEMHPGFCVYNPATLLKLREAVGDTIGANLDPSHLLWQGMDIIDVIYELKDAIYYFHAKDTELNMINVRKNGVLDVKHYSDLANRAWTFRTMGYGTDKWKHIISALKIIGYDDSISIEHEDPLMAPFEGLEKAIDYLKPMLIDGGGAKMWWA
jgi:sugar phosphate isomerase/epimerase